jgi:ATP-dependent Clp protease ATP-binding subunit ClpA
MNMNRSRKLKNSLIGFTALLLLSFSMTATAAPSMFTTGPKSNAHEEIVPLPQSNYLFLKNAGERWQVGIVGPQGQRSLLFEGAQVSSVTRFAEGPSTEFQRPWTTHTMMNHNGLVPISTWFMFSSENGYHFVRRMRNADSPFALFNFTEQNSPPKKMSSNHVRDAEGQYYFLFSWQTQTGHEATYLVREDGHAISVAKKFIDLGEGTDSATYQVVNDVLKFKADSSIKIKIGTEFEPTEGVHVVHMKTIPASAPTAAEPRSQSLVGAAISRASETLKSGVAGLQQQAEDLGIVTPRAQFVERSGSVSAHVGQATVSHQPASEQEAPPEIPLPRGAKTHKVMYGELEYEVFSSEEKDNSGTFIRRVQDGKTVKISTKQVEFLNPGGDERMVVQVQDGILSHPLLLRQIDMDKFDIEERYTPTLAEAPVEWFDSNFTDGRHTGRVKVKPVAKRKDIIENVRTTLSSRGKSSTVLFGDAGDMESIIDTAIESLPRTWRVAIFDSSSIAADIKYSGVLGEKVKKIETLNHAIPIIWKADDFENLADAGKSESGPGVLSLLKKQIDNGTMKIAGIAGITFQDRVKDPQLLKALAAQNVTPLTNAEVDEALLNWEAAHPGYPKTTAEFRKYVHRTAADLDPAGAEPLRTLDLMENVFAFLEAQNRLKAENLVKAEVDLGATRVYQMDPAMRNRDLQRVRLRNLLPALNSRIIGQEHLKNEFYEAAKNILAGLKEGRGPAFSYFIDGPPGVGKTEIFKVYADILGLPFVPIEMNQFDGVALGKEDLIRQIAQALRKNPYSIILLDEIEKANPKVLEGLLTIFSSDTFTYYEELAGKKIPLKASAINAQIGMTSNAIGDLVQASFNKTVAEEKERLKGEVDKVVLDGYQLREAFLKNVSYDQMIEQIVERGIPRPLLDRCQVIDVAFPPTHSALVQILNIKLSGMSKIVDEQMEITAQFKNGDKYMNSVAINALNQGWSTRAAIAKLVKHAKSSASDLSLDEKFTTGRKYDVDLMKPASAPGHGAGNATCEAIVTGKAK